MKKKRLISVMLAGLMTAGVAVTTTGCDQDIENGKEFAKCNDVYIVIDNENEKIVHKGDVMPMHCDVGHFSWGSGFAELNFDCGKSYLTNADCYIYKNKPIKNVDYTQACEDCFSLDENA